MEESIARRIPQQREALGADVGPVSGIHTSGMMSLARGEVTLKSLHHTPFELRTVSDGNLKVKP